MKAVKTEGKCSTCGWDIRKGEAYSTVGRTKFHATYVGCSEAETRADVHHAIAHRERFVIAAMRVPESLDY